MSEHSLIKDDDKSNAEVNLPDIHTDLNNYQLPSSVETSQNSMAIVNLSPTANHQTKQIANNNNHYMNVSVRNRGFLQRESI